MVRLKFLYYILYVDDDDLLMIVEKARHIYTRKTIYIDELRAAISSS